MRRAPDRRAARRPSRSEQRAWEARAAAAERLREWRQHLGPLAADYATFVEPTSEADCLTKLNRLGDVIARLEDARTLERRGSAERQRYDQLVRRLEAVKRDYRTWLNLTRHGTPAPLYAADALRAAFDPAATWQIRSARCRS